MISPNASFLTFILILGPLCGMAFMFLSYRKIMTVGEGTLEMVQLGGIIRSGAKTFMDRQYKTILIVATLLAVFFALVVHVTAGVTFLFGAVMSSLGCIISMRVATRANVRTTNVALMTRSIGKTTQFAALGGGVTGTAVMTFGLLGAGMLILVFGWVKLHDVGYSVVLHLETNPSVMRLTAYSLGCSIVAMFNRVGGGNFTKGADISSDYLGKVCKGLPEDDKRNVCSIADFIGDIVNDISGNCSDLLESFVASISAAVSTALLVYSRAVAGEDAAMYSETLFERTSAFPFIVAVIGLFACICGLLFIMFRKLGDNPAKELDRATYVSAALTLIGAFILTKVMFSDITLYPEFKLGWISPFVPICLGVVTGVVVGKITEYYTSYDHKPVQGLMNAATDGTPYLITLGRALGSRSCLATVAIICISIFASGWFCGTYGVGVCAFGMLSFVGITVSIDAFGPIADNAGGIAEFCHLDEAVRSICDTLDAVGNTTAAIGKGHAIGSASLSTVSLNISYVALYTIVTQEPILNAASWRVVPGILFGGALLKYFSALLANGTIDSARKLAGIGKKEFDRPGVMEGTALPKYELAIGELTTNSLKKMPVPSLLPIVAVSIMGLLFGAEMAGGMILGATIVAVMEAIDASNSGGAFDNAKKGIEAGLLPGHGKGSPAHKAAVEGDTVGDELKDHQAVSFDIFIKSMATTAIILVPIFVNYAIFR